MLTHQKRRWQNPNPTDDLRYTAAGPAGVWLTANQPKPAEPKTGPCALCNVRIPWDRWAAGERLCRQHQEQVKREGRVDFVCYKGEQK